MKTNKKKAALSSVIAAIFLTAMKTVVGLLTGSLGILSEALHSTLDLVAALITMLAVRFSDKPADSKHHYGHGKIESFSALIETALLLVTSGWIIYEAIEKLFFGKSMELVGIQWGLLVMVISIVVDLSRSRLLYKAAKEHNSQALKADALHFSTDVWSSSVVIVGLACVWIGDAFGIAWLKYADPIAAMGVALIVIQVSLKMGKETIDVLLDTAPRGMRETIEAEIAGVHGVLSVADIRIRPSGAVHYIDVNVGVDPNRKQTDAHRIVHEIRSRITEKYPNSDVIVGTFPADAGSVEDIAISNALEAIMSQVPNCENVHNVHVYELGGRKKITAHAELRENLTLGQSHELSHRVSDLAQASIPGVDYVNLYFQRSQQGVQAEEVTAERGELASAVGKAVGELRGDVSCHDVQLYAGKHGISAFLHCTVPEDYRMDKLEEIQGQVKTGLKKLLPELGHIHIHFEPDETSK